MILPLHEVPGYREFLDDLAVHDVQFVFILQIDDFSNFNVHIDSRSAEILREAVYLRLADANKGRFRLYTNGGSRFFFTSTQEIPKEEVIRSFCALQNCACFEEIIINDEKLSVSTTVGFSYNRPDIFETARIAIERAKARGVPFHEFTDEDTEKTNHFEKAKWNYKLMRGFKSRNLVPWFQPIQDLKTAKIERFEALARYVSPDGEVFPASSFLPIVSDSRIVHQLSRVIFKRTLERYGDSEFGFSINVGASDIENDLTVESIFKTIEESKHPDRLVLELIETQELSNSQRVDDFVAGVRSLGAKIAIDDFGSGFSNYEQVLRLEPEFLKIDGTLIKEIDHDKKSLILVEHITRFCLKMGIQSIAEHVHSMEIANIVRDLGVDFAQGYHISPAIPDPNAFIQDWKQNHQ